MNSATNTGSRYRYRFQGRTSEWMSGEKLQSEAQTGAFDETAEIQMSGHPDWRLAKTISALTFQTPDPELEEAPAVDADDRLTRFGSIRELMAAFVREDIEMDYRQTGQFERAHLCAISSDHFETIDEDGSERVFIPLHQIRSIVAIDTGGNGRNYRENHTLRVTLV